MWGGRGRGDGRAGYSVGGWSGGCVGGRGGCSQRPRVPMDETVFVPGSATGACCVGCVLCSVFCVVCIVCVVQCVCCVLFVLCGVICVVCGGRCGVGNCMFVWTGVCQSRHR
jgi:hypothetical protein